MIVSRPRREGGLETAAPVGNRAEKGGAALVKPPFDVTLKEKSAEKRVGAEGDFSVGRSFAGQEGGTRINGCAL